MNFSNTAQGTFAEYNSQTVTANLKLFLPSGSGHRGSMRAPLTRPKGQSPAQRKALGFSRSDLHPGIFAPVA